MKIPHSLVLLLSQLDWILSGNHTGVIENLITVNFINLNFIAPLQDDNSETLKPSQYRRSNLNHSAKIWQFCMTLRTYTH